MKSLVFDAGPIISLTTNNLLWLIQKLKQRYGGDFLIPKEVQYELVDKPLEIKIFKFEALEVMNEIRKGNLKVVSEPKIQALKQELLSMANGCYSAKGVSIKLVHEGEMASLATALVYNSDAVVIDERTTRELIENPEGLARLMEKRLKTKVTINSACVDRIREKIGGLKIIRSVELAMAGFELGWFDEYLPLDKDARKTLIEAILWGIKMRGAAISQEEIDRIVRLEK